MMTITDSEAKIVTEMSDKVKISSIKSNTLTAMKTSANNNNDDNDIDNNGVHCKLSRSLNDLILINNDDSNVQSNGKHQLPISPDKINDEKIFQRKIHLGKFSQKSYNFLQNITNRMISNKFRSDHSLANSSSTSSTNSFTNKHSSTLSLFYQRYLSNSTNKPKRTISGKFYQKKKN